MLYVVCDDCWMRMVSCAMVQQFVRTFSTDIYTPITCYHSEWWLYMFRNAIESLVLNGCERDEFVCHSTCFFSIRFFFFCFFQSTENGPTYHANTRMIFLLKSVPTRATSDFLSVRGTKRFNLFMNICRVFIKWFFFVSHFGFVWFIFCFDLVFKWMLSDSNY